MSRRLEGKTILITGASSTRRVDSLKQIAAEINEEVGNGVNVLPVQLDVNKPSEVRVFVGKLPTEFKEIDVLVNNA
ncbi:hypothetical protein F5Y01DRAFT_315847 [Xylaria sp. FL0043]|nr:hypothetical protein F5Y01DRAFT_315847 [Xylaria sp. FL0043]